MPERTIARRDALGVHGYVYMDSLADTGPTRSPRTAQLAGGTGNWGDPFWETLSDPSQKVLLFTVPQDQRAMVPLAPVDSLAAVWKDRLLILPSTSPSPRPTSATDALTTKAPPLAFEEVLTQLRSQAGLSVSDLATLLCVSRRQFYNWLSSEHLPDFAHEEHARRLAQVIDILHGRFGEARLVRSALLSLSPHGTIYDALRDGHFDRADAAAEALPEPASAKGPVGLSESQRERAMLELSHLRDDSHAGDGRPR
jgi:transcriptional regulator with XRE-family HTH domain